ncbi:unnamed protein product [Sphagnum balticum]
MMRLDLASGESLKTWRFSTMKRWHVNWEIKHVLVVHEFIGGYIFCSLRNKEQNTTLNEELFHRLTGGWHGNYGTVAKTHI